MLLLFIKTQDAPSQSWARRKGFRCTTSATCSTHSSSDVAYACVLQYHQIWAALWTHAIVDAPVGLMQGYGGRLFCTNCSSAALALAAKTACFAFTVVLKV